MEVVRKKSWFAQNWLWVVPVGGCLTVILLIVFGVGAAIFGVSKWVENATPYSYAVEMASNDPSVIEYLGEPIETAGIMRGNMSFENDDGRVDIAIPLEGPNGRASLVVKGVKTDGEWVYEELYVIIKANNERINLLRNNLEII
jgi:hypothetical protein